MTTQDNNTNEQTVLYNASELYNFAQALANNEAKRAEYITKHEQAKALVAQIGLNKKQAEAYRATLGLGASLESDLATLEIDEDIVDVMDALDNDPSVAVWRKHVKEVDTIMQLLTTVNELRRELGKAEISLSYTGISKSKGVARGDNGSRENSSKRAMYCRPGSMRIKFNQVMISWVANTEEYTLTNEGNPSQTKTYTQGTIGVHSAFKSFVQETLGYAKSNVSTPFYLLASGYNKADVYMLTKPDADTTLIPQPVQETE